MDLAKICISKMVYFSCVLKFTLNIHVVVAHHRPGWSPFPMDIDFPTQASMRLSCHLGHVWTISAESQEIEWPVSLQCSASADILSFTFLNSFFCVHGIPLLQTALSFHLMYVTFFTITAKNL